MSTFVNYATYGAQQLPFIWAPNPYGDPGGEQQACTASRSTPLYTLLPEYWYFTK